MKSNADLLKSAITELALVVIGSTLFVLWLSK